MASQVKKNKNQFLRKGIATSAVRNTLQDANIADVSTIQSGVERIQIETPDVSSGVHSGVERVPNDTPILNSGVQSGVERVPIDTLILNSGVWSGTERDQINIPNVNSGEITGSLRSTQKCAEGVNLDALYKRPATNSRTEVGGRSVRSEEDSDAGGTMHACTMYNQSSEYVPKLHSESCSKPITDSFSRSAIKNFAGKQTYDHVDNNHAPPLPKNPPPDLPAKPPRMAKYKTWHQHSSPANRGVNQRSTDLKHHSSKLQMEYSPQFSNNLSDDGEENEDLLWEYPGERTLIGQQMMASDIQYPNLKEHSQMHYGEEGILDNIEQGNQSSKAGHMLGGQYGEQTGQILGGHPGGHTQHMQGGLYTRNMGKMHPFGSDSGDRPSWQKERYSGQFQDGQHVTGFLMHGMEHVGPVPTRNHAGTVGPEPNMHHAGTMGPGPTRHDAGAMGPGPNMHHAGTMGPGPTSHYAGAMGPGPNMHHAGTMGPGPTSHYAGAMGPGPNMHHAGTIGPGPNRHHTGAMEPGPNMHHAGTMGQMPYQLNEGSIKQMHKSSVGQMHGGSVGQMYGGSVGQMHPYAQSDAMHSFGQEYMEEFQDVQYEHDDMGQPWTFPDTLQGYSQGNASYSPAASSFPGPSTNITDRELASGQLDQRMNNPWFEKLVQNMKELVEREGLIFKDVFPDGNCLFTAVIDQLRVRGNFNFTPSTLRAAAVAFLRENPKQHDGTHLEQFLMNESWDQYLSRMGKDGEWGEHIILGAMSEVLKCRIIVLGGMSGNSRTVVQPQRMSDEEEKKAQKEKEANDSEVVKDESLAGTAKSEVTAAESHSLQAGAASSTSKADAKTKGTDTSHRKDKTSSLSKQNKKDEELQMGEDLYIGLLGEMHYVSLRKKDWEERLNEKLRARIQKRKAKQRQEAGQIDDSSSDDDLCLPEDLVRKTLKSNERRGQEGNKNADNESINSVLDSVSLLPLPYLNFLLNLVISEEYITHQDSRTAPTASIYPFDAEISSLSQSMLEPCVRLRTFTTRHMIGGSNIRTKKRKPKIHFTRNDSKAVFTWRNTLKDADFVISEETSESGYLRLVPVKPNIWEGCHLALVEDTIYLKRTIANCKPFASLAQDSTATVGFSCLWPAKAEEWITRKRLNNVPSSADIERIVDLGCKIVPATIGNDIEWEYSFHTNERVFFTGIVTKEQRNLFLLLTSIIDHLHDLDNIEYDDILTSVYLYACEEIPNKAWLDNPSFCVCKIIDMILDGLRAGFLPNYFMRCKNILKGRSQIDLERLLDILEILRSNPLSCLHFLFDGYGYSGTEFGITFDAVICDFHAVGSETEITQRFLKFLTNVAQRKSDMREPDQDLYQNERMTQVQHGMNFCHILSLFDKICASFAPVQMWCALLTMARLMGQPLTQLIRFQHESVNSVEIFGPDFTALFGDIQIPKTCSYGINMVCFVVSFAKLIFLIWPLDKAMALGLRYFLLHKAHEARSVLPDLNDLSFFSVQERAMSILMFMSLYIVYVTDLYRQLYNTAVRLQETDLLVDMIGPLERFCYLIGTPNQYEVLADFYQLIGDDNKARQARSRAVCT